MSKLLLPKRLAQGVLATATTLAVVSGVGMPQVSVTESSGLSARVDWKQPTQALAQSGGRSSGGSFGSSSGGSSGSQPSGGSSSSRSYNNSYSSYDNDSYSGEGEGSLYMMVFLLGILVLVSLMSEHEKENDYPRQPIIRSEKDNDTVTVTQIQIVMKDRNGDIKRSLNRIATKLDWRTNFGLNNALKQTVELLMSAPENWTHANGQSTTTLTREMGRHRFEALSKAERSKFEVASLINIDGNIQLNPDSLSQPHEATLASSLEPDSDEKASDDDYLVVTLIVGTAHDNPLLYNIGSADQLANKLRQLKAIDSSYLFKYELLWSPQKEQETLSAIELQEKYPNLSPIDGLVAHTKLLVKKS